MGLWATIDTMIVTTESTSAIGNMAMLVIMRPAEPMKGTMSRTALMGERIIPRPIHMARKPTRRRIQVCITCSPCICEMACSWVPRTTRMSLSLSPVV